MRSMRTAVLSVLLVIVAAPTLAGCGRSADDDGNTPAKAASASEALKLDPSTPEASGDAGTVAWATYRPVAIIDPLQAFDYPDVQAVTAMCESVVRQNPDGTISDGLTALSRPDPTTIVLTVDDSARFWDGSPVTAEDVAYSLNRNLDPKVFSFYRQSFARVASIEAAAENEVTISLKAPDYWLHGELSAMPGVVVKKRFAEAAGKRFGTPAGGTMCTGAYELREWQAGDVMSLERNENYWGPDKAVSKRLDLRGVPDESALTSALLTGEINGFYPPGAFSALEQVRDSDAVQVSEGPSNALDAFLVSNLDGVLGDLDVRRALSMAIDRKAYIERSYHGAALLPRTAGNPGTWGYAKGVFEDDWDSLPDPAYDAEEGKRLVDAAGAAGKTIVIGMTNEVAPLVTVSNSIRAAAERIGLKVKFKAVPAAEFISFFTDPKARADVDGFPTVGYPNYSDPAGVYYAYATPDGQSNYSGFEDEQITSVLEQARETEDAEERAKLVVEVGHRVNEQLPFIPIALPTLIQVHGKDITGAPASFVYMGGPWANGIGTR